MKTCIEIFKHEVSKIFMDRKLLASFFLLPVIIVLVTSFLSGSPADSQEETYRVYALDHMPSEQTAEGVTIIPVEQKTIEELRNSVKLESTDVVLGRKDTEILIYYNSADTVSVSLAQYCRKMMFDQALASFAGANMVDISSRVSVENVNTQNDSGNSLIASLLPYMLVLLLFQSVSTYSIDTIAGEKERGVFSKILLAPVAPGSVICGKLLSSIVCGILSSLVYIVVVVAVPHATGIDPYGFMEADIPATALPLFILCAVLLGCFFASIGVLLSLYAKTVKEAQSARLPVYGVTMVLALIAMPRVGDAPYAHYAIPIYNICLVMQDILDSSVGGGKMMIAVVSLSVCSALVIGATVLSFKRESVRY